MNSFYHSYEFLSFLNSNKFIFVVIYFTKTHYINQTIKQSSNIYPVLYCYYFLTLVPTTISGRSFHLLSYHRRSHYCSRNGKRVPKLNIKHYHSNGKHHVKNMFHSHFTPIIKLLLCLNCAGFFHIGCLIL